MLDYIELEAYRAYFNKTTFKFAVPKDGKLGLTVLVGQNNAGKTTPLDMIKKVFAENLDLIFERESRHDLRNPSVVVGVNFDFAVGKIICQPDNLGAYAKKNFQFDAVQQVAKETQFNTIRRRVKFVPSRRHWSDRFQRQGSMNIPHLEDILYRTARGQEAPLGQLLANILFSDKKEDFNKVLRKIAPNVIDWTVDSDSSQESVTYVTKQNKVHSIGALGDGFVSIFRLAYTLYSSAPGDTIVLDEPELSLHPEAQKALYFLLRDLSQDRQVIVATHSPYMINWKDIEKGAMIYRLSLDVNGHVQIGTISASSYRKIKGAVVDDFKNTRLFDVLAKEVFFREGVVFCEGAEDVHLIENYLEESGQPPLPLFGYGSGGASFLSHWLRIADEIKLRSVAIFDLDQEQAAKACSAEFAGNDDILILVLPRDDIRDKYLRDGNCSVTGKCREVTAGSPWKAGFFDSKGRIKHDHKVEFDNFLEKIRSFLLVS